MKKIVQTKKPLKEFGFRRIKTDIENEKLIRKAFLKPGQKLEDLAQNEPKEIKLPSEELTYDNGI
jgi:hypothetical protein